MTEFKEDEVLVIEKGAEYVTGEEPFIVKGDLSKTYPELAIRIKKVVIGEGIVGILDDAFMGFVELCEVALPDGLT